MVNLRKVPSAHTAVGYWGRSPHGRILSEETPQRIRALLQDQLRAGGLRMRLWQSVHSPLFDQNSLESGTLGCTCVKKTGESAERRCRSCYGITTIPGYRLFGHETLWLASVSPGLTLSGLVLDTTLKPNRLALLPTATTGTAESGDIFYVRPPVAGGAWETESIGVVQDGANSSITVEVSLDRGASWSALSTLPSLNPPSGPIRFRVTLARATVSVRSPLWEILRVRFPTLPVVGRQGPWILALRSVTPDKPSQGERGIILDSGANRFWTAPLAFFDPSIPDQASVDGPMDRRTLLEDPAFIEFLDGARALLPERWTLTDNAYSDSMGYLTRQYFTARLVQAQEYTADVF